MSARALRSIFLGLALLTAGCTTERGTGPPTPPPEVVATTKLPAMSILDDPIVAISGSIGAGRWPSDKFEVMYGVHLPSELLPGIERVDDAWIRYCYLFHGSELSIYNPKLDRWLELPEPTTALYNVNGFCGHFFSLLEIGMSYVEFAGSGEMRFAGDSTEEVSVRLIQYHSDFVQVHLGRVALGYHPTALAVNHDEIWIAHDGWIDVHDSTGVLVRSFDVGRGGIRAMAFHEGYIWAMVYPGWTFLQLDDDGQVVREFGADPPECTSPFCTEQIPRGMTSAMGVLWVAHEPDHIRGFDTEASLAADSGVIAARHKLELGGWFPIDFAWDGSVFRQISEPPLTIFTRTRMMALDASGARLSHIDPATSRIGWIDCVGTDLWAIHYGGFGSEPVGSGHLYLSRFTLPEVIMPEGTE